MEHKNQTPDPARPVGWRFETPTGWRQGAVNKFPFPLGEGWTGEDGQLQVCWLGTSVTMGQEQYNLEQRGYARTDTRVGGREAVVLQQNQDTYCYVNTPKGTCRLHLVGSNPTQQRILRSFGILDVIQAPVGEERRFASWSFEMPPGWKWLEPDTLLVDGAPVCKLTSHSVDRQLMVRGWARVQAQQENADLKERVEMEPFTSRHGNDGYLVEWRTAGGDSRIFGYLAENQKGLRLELLKLGELDRLRRLLMSVQYRP